MTEPTISLVPAMECTISPTLLRKLWIYTCVAQSEISAIGEVDINGNRLHLLDTIHFVKQQNTWGSTHLDIDELAKVIGNKVRSGGSARRMRFWFHTHPGAVFFSGTDQGTIDDLVKRNGINPLVAAVFNDHGESRWCLVHGNRALEWDYKHGLARPTKQERREARALLEPVVVKDSWWWSRGRDTGYHDMVLECPKCKHDNPRWKMNCEECNTFLPLNLVRKKKKSHDTEEPDETTAFDDYEKDRKDDEGPGEQRPLAI